MIAFGHIYSIGPKKVIPIEIEIVIVIEWAIAICIDFDFDSDFDYPKYWKTHLER